MHENQRNVLLDVASQFGTPSFVYFAQPIRDTVAALENAFQGEFELSYAAKCNPNKALLKLLRHNKVHLDASSIGEVERGIEAGFEPFEIGFSGPAKRLFEIERAVELGLGAIICESVEQIEAVNSCALHQGKVQEILIRVNPAKVPRKFGLVMGGQPSQFGIDEEALAVVPAVIESCSGVRLKGFHIFSGGNSLDEDAIVENFGLMMDLFRKCAREFNGHPMELVFGAGFGIPYFEGDKPLNLETLSKGILGLVGALRGDACFESTRLILEMGRYLVGPHGYMLTSVVGTKHSRGSDLLLCDAGFNNNLSAAGMMGTVLRRDWQFWNISRPDQAETEVYRVVGPLCASFDILGASIALPESTAGDFLAVGSSGAYGLSASPTRFISHPEPLEFIIDEVEGDEKIINVTESMEAHPSWHTNRGITKVDA
jgi:diaminopimelate decarboxylase